MALPFTFINESGDQSASQLDTNFDAVAAMGITDFAVSGGTADAIQLTQTANQSAFAFAAGQFASFLPTATPTGGVTLAVNGQTAVPLYYADGVTQCGVGAWSGGTGIILIAYNPALNGTQGGYVLVNVQSTPGQLLGTATNDNATTGNVGEDVSATIALGSAVALNNGTAADIGSIALGAGDWDVWGCIFFAPQSGTTTTRLAGSIGTASGVIPAFPGNGAAAQWQGSITAVTGLTSLSLVPARLSEAAPFTAYLTAVAAFSGGSLSGFGVIHGRRVR